MALTLALTAIVSVISLSSARLRIAHTPPDSHSLSLLFRFALPLLAVLASLDFRCQMAHEHVQGGLGGGVGGESIFVVTECTVGAAVGGDEEDFADAGGGEFVEEAGGNVDGTDGVGC